MSIFSQKQDRSALSKMDVLDNATNEPTGYHVMVRSIDHPKVQIALVAYNRAKGEGKEEQSIEEELAANTAAAVELAIAMTESWNFKDDHDKAIPCDAESVRELLSNDQMFRVRDQIVKHGMDTTSHFRSSTERTPAVGKVRRVAVSGSRKSK